MQLHLEGPTGPHGEIKLPAPASSEFEPPVPKNEPDQDQTEPEILKLVYVN